MKLNLGCGEKKLDGYVNVDICGDPDVKVDLSQFPWPFEDASAEEVLSEHFLEHVIDYDRTIREIHRILKPGGINRFKVPHFRSSFFPWHLHVNAFSTMTCRRLCEQLPYQYDGRRLFEEVSLRLNYYYLRPCFRGILSALANISPVKWDYFGMPVDELEYVCRKV